ncbi:MAG: hypothetical protein IK062_04070 [Selenomonadaceae bacterium]|nr:hypothetical protein [Selenomonadaceae bacterium]
MKENYLNIDYGNEHREIVLENLSENNFEDLLSGIIKDNLAEMIEEYGIFYDAEPYPCGYCRDEEEILFETDKPRLKNFLSEVKICFDKIDGSFENIDGMKYQNTLWEYFYGGENFYCRAATLICRSVEIFMEKGEWQFGLAEGDISDGDLKIYKNPADWDQAVFENDFALINSKKLRPIIWFGLPDEEPIENWIIDPYNLLVVLTKIKRPKI